MFSHLNMKEKMNACLGIMKLWLKFQESLAAVIEPDVSSQKSWCEHIRGGESVWDACGKEHLQAERGQKGCSESSEGCCAGANNVESGLLPKGLRQKKEMDGSVTKQNKTSLTVHALWTDQCWWALEQSSNRESQERAFGRKGPKTERWLWEENWSSRESLVQKWAFQLCPFLVPCPFLSSFSVSDTDTQTWLWTWLKGQITLHIKKKILSGKNQTLIKLSPGLYIQTVIKTLCRTGEGRGKFWLTCGQPLLQMGLRISLWWVTLGEPIWTGTSPAHTGILESQFLCLRWGVSQAFLTDDEQPVDFWAAKNLKHEVHQSWVKTSGHALGCFASPAEEHVQLEAYLLPTAVVKHSLRKAPGKPIPNILLLKKGKNPKTQEKCYQQVLENRAIFRSSSLLSTIYSGYTSTRALKKAGIQGAGPPLVPPHTTAVQDILPRCIICVSWPWIVTNTSHHPPFPSD